MRTSLIFWRRSYKRSLLLLVVIIALSAYTHMWNPAGVPILHGDEGTYIKRGVGVLNGEILYGLHDHPFFGQVVIAGFMHVAGYQDLLDDPPEDPSHIRALYAYPRAFMGLLAVLDTLLVYLIADRLFGRRVAAVAAVAFAVAPMSLLLRMVLLDSILLPFVLSSVLLALYSRGPADGDGRRRYALLLASGACMGLAIFTKVPAVAMIPPCALLAFWARRRIREAGLWLVPALAIPAVWPAYAAWAGQSDAWIRDVVWQAGRSNDGLPEAARWLFSFDPVLISAGLAGFAFAVICLVLRPGRGRRTAGAAGTGEGKGGGGPSHDPARAAGQVPAGAGASAGRDPGLRAAEPQSLGFLAVWFSSILLFFASIGYVSFFHFSMLLPALCVAAAVLILRVGGRLARSSGDRTQDRIALIAVVTIGVAGLSTAGAFMYFDAQSSEFEVASFLLQNHSDDPNTVKIMHPPLSWVLSDVYGIQNVTTYFKYDGQKGAERILLAISDHRIGYYSKLAEPCGDPSVRTGYAPGCHVSPHIVNMLEIYGKGSLIREFGRESGELIGVLPPLPVSVERHLVNSYKITEWLPAG